MRSLAWRQVGAAAEAGVLALRTGCQVKRGSGSAGAWVALAPPASNRLATMKVLCIVEPTKVGGRVGPTGTGLPC